MQWYIIISYLLLISTTLSLSLSIIYFRHMLIKPSTLVLGFYHIQIQWSGTLQSELIYTNLPNPYEFLIVLHGFPLLGLFLSLMLFRKQSLCVFNSIKSSQTITSNRAILALAAISLLIILYYLSVVPLKSSGLYAILFNPSLAIQSREDSLTLLDNVYLKYGYTFLRSVFAPMLSVLVFHKCFEFYKNKRYVKSAAFLLFLFLTILSVMLPGDRASAANIILAIIFSLFLKKGMPLKPHIIIGSGIFVLLIPVILSILREGRVINFNLIVDYLSTGIFRRVFSVPLETGLWHAHYAQTNGFFGIEGIPKLASLYGKEPISISNLIYQLYTSAPIPSGTANTSYVFSYYSMFGVSSILLSVIGLCLLDIVLLLYRRLPVIILAPVLSVSIIPAMRFVSSDYTTTLLTGGYLLIPCTALALLFILKLKR